MNRHLPVRVAVRKLADGRPASSRYQRAFTPYGVMGSDDPDLDRGLHNHISQRITRVPGECPACDYDRWCMLGEEG